MSSVVIIDAHTILLTVVFFDSDLFGASIIKFYIWNVKSLLLSFMEYIKIITFFIESYPADNNGVSILKSNSHSFNLSSLDELAMIN
jgi:hypothetical protein